MKKIRASVVIPNWNGKNLLEDCLQSLENQSLKDFEIILVDNGSEDESIKYAQDNFPQVKIIKLERNFGFARAINEGVKASVAEYVVFLNNDTEVDKEWLKNLIYCARGYPEVISVNSKLLNFYDRKIIDGVGILINEIGQARSVGWQEKDLGQFDKEQYIFGATGGASLFRRADFIKVGGFDENYFMYSEEVDFAFRAQFQGYKSIFCSKAVVYHKHKASARGKPQHIEYWQFRNMTQTIIKDFPTSVLFKRWRWLKIIAVHLNTIFYQVRNGYFWPPLLAMLWILFHLPKLLDERRKIQINRKVSDEYIENFLKEKKITFWGLWR
ncbi:MAG: glycosyltransferase family 2 protein [Candidatus Daviesbacteria bacterium]|nr:glycosyltransferase family 2 protein [Candidatus Daviesbacteria bacterium]